MPGKRIALSFLGLFYSIIHAKIGILVKKMHDRQMANLYVSCGLYSKCIAISNVYKAHNERETYYSFATKAILLLLLNTVSPSVKKLKGAIMNRSYNVDKLQICTH